MHNTGGITLQVIDNSKPHSKLQTLHSSCHQIFENKVARYHDSESTPNNILNQPEDYSLPLCSLSKPCLVLVDQLAEDIEMPWSRSGRSRLTVRRLVNLGDSIH